MQGDYVKRLEEYNLQLKTLPIGEYEYVYHLDDAYFEAIEATDVKIGDLDARVKVDKSAHNIEINFDICGEIGTICDRCLGDLTLEVKLENRLIVKFGKEYSEESDEMIIISEDEGTLNIAWFMYEFIVLSLPISRVHEEGECNEDMISLYSEYVVSDIDEYVEEHDEEKEKKEVDPRWAALKNIFDNN